MLLYCRILLAAWILLAVQSGAQTNPPEPDHSDGIQALIGVDRLLKRCDDPHCNTITAEKTATVQQLFLRQQITEA